MILPVKRLDDAKQRLSARLPAHERRALMAAMLEDVLSALEQVRVAHELLVVTGDSHAARAAHARRARVMSDADAIGHSAAAALGVRAALASGAERVVLIPGDCPLLAPGELEGLLRLPPAEHGRVVVVPDRDGTGTNALLLEPPAVIAPAFGPGSHDRHVEAARSAGVPVHTERLASLMLDVDTPADLDTVAEALAGCPDAAPRTAAVLAGRPVAGLATR